MSDFRWLIEAPGQRYLSAAKIGNGYVFRWTQQHESALYFWSSEQADFTMMAIRALDPPLFAFATTLGDAKAVEHAWVSADG